MSKRKSEAKENEIRRSSLIFYLSQHLISSRDPVDIGCKTERCEGQTHFQGPQLGDKTESDQLRAGLAHS